MKSVMLNQTTLGTAPQHTKCSVITAWRSQIVITGREDQRLDSCCSLQFLEEAWFRNVQGKGTHVTRGTTASCRWPGTTTQATLKLWPFSGVLAIFVKHLKGSKQQLNRLQGITKRGGAAMLLTVCSALGQMVRSKLESSSTVLEGPGHRLT